MKKRLLTLALALAAVCAMAVTAMAATPPAGLTWTGGNLNCAHDNVTEEATTDATCTTAGSKVWKCSDCNATATETIPATGEHEWDAGWTSDGTNHWHKCTADPNCTAKNSQGTCATTRTDFNADTTNHCKVCDTCEKAFGTTAHTFVFQQVGTDQHQEKCSVCSYTKDAESCTMEHSFNNTHHFDKCSKCGRTTTPEAHTETGTWLETTVDGVNYHYQACTNCDAKLKLGLHTPGATKTYVDANKHSATCTVCSKTVEFAHTFTATVNATDATKHDKTCTCTNFNNGNGVITEAHTFGANGKCTLCNYSNAGVPDGADITTANFNLAAGRTQALAFVVKSGANVTTSREKVTFASSNTTVATVTSAGVVTARSAGTAIISICINGVAKDTVTVTVTRSHNIAVTVTSGTNAYYFGDKSTSNGYSISDYIIGSITVPSGVSLSSYTVTFTNPSNTVGTLGSTNTGATTLANIGNVYLTVASSGTWTANYTVTYGGNVVQSGSISIVIAPNNGIDILYTATLGQTITLQLADFQKFWSEETSRYNTLSSVRINTVTGVSGTLCYNHRSNEGYTHNNASGGTFYVSPSAVGQNSLSALSFVPAKYGSSYTAGSVTISFTAFGTNRYNATESVNGNIVIVYTNGAVQDITYTALGSSYTPFIAADFNNVFKAATASTVTNPSFTIKFLDVPVYGTLYHYAYNTGYTNGTALTKENLGSYSFTNQSGSVYSIDRVSYVPGRYSTAADGVRYAVYSGNSLLYIGKVNFNSKVTTVSYSCNSNGTYFRASDFFGNEAMLGAQFISFGTPSSGALYKNYSAGKGNAVVSTDFFTSAITGAASLNNVVYIPAANFTGVVEIPFYASTSTSNYATGTLKIYVVAKPFSDVGNDWSTQYINRLYASGIVSGTSATTFSPKSSMKYGEALKMILQAAGYPKQVEGTGSNWAYNYLAFAYQKGIVSSMNINLNEAISRDAMAEIAAKALGLTKASYVNVGVDGPTDSTNGYVYALYNAGIVGGDSSSGVNKYYGSRNINRDEVAKIICNIMDYKA